MTDAEFMRELAEPLNETSNDYNTLLELMSVWDAGELAETFRLGFSVLTLTLFLIL